MNNIILKSEIDSTVNFVNKDKTSITESRYVNRRQDDFTCYLSSHDGCNKGCKFCWLTQTKQTSFKESTIHDIVQQANHVVEYSKQFRHKQINFSFMARGEPLSSNIIVNDWNELSNSLMALTAGLYRSTFNISTIFPKDFKNNLSDCFSVNSPTFYYSLYSLNNEIRKEWIPGGVDPEIAIQEFKKYQLFSGKIVKIHGAIIRDVNDTRRNWKSIIELINDYRLIVEYQIVRYNPIDESKEYDDIRKISEFINYESKSSCKIIEKVGTDVYASCGMFMT